MFLWILFVCNVNCLPQVRKKSKEVGKAEKQLQMDLAAIEAVSLLINISFCSLCIGSIIDLTYTFLSLFITHRYLVKCLNTVY